MCAMPVFADDTATTPTTPSMGSQKRDNTNAAAGTDIVAGNTSVYYKVTESYQWSIPATIDFGVNAGVNNTSTVNATLKEDGPGTKADAGNKWKGTAPKVVVSKNVIGVGKTLKIAIDTKNNYPDTFDTTANKFYVEAEFKKTGSQTSVYEKLYFTITKSTADTTSKTTLNKDNNVVMTVPAGTNKGEQALEFKLETTKETAEKAGDYVGHVYFFSELV